MPRWIRRCGATLSARAGGSAASIYSKSPTAMTVTVHYQSGIDPYYLQIYIDKYVKLDPTMIARYFADVGQPIAAADIIPHHELMETRFYKEWVQPQGIAGNLSAVLDKSATS